MYNDRSVHWKWIVFVTFKIPLQVLICISVYHTFRGLLPVAICNAIAALGCCFYLYLHMTDKHSSVRYMAIAWGAVVGLAFVYNVALHGYLSRGYDAAKEKAVEVRQRYELAKAEREKQAEYDLKRLDAETEAAKARTAEAKQAAIAADAAARLYRTTGGRIASRPAAPAPAQSDNGTAAAPAPAVDTLRAEDIPDPADYLNSQSTHAFIALLAEIVCLLMGVTFVSVVKSWASLPSNPEPGQKPEKGHAPTPAQSLPEKTASVRAPHPVAPLRTPRGTSGGAEPEPEPEPEPATENSKVLVAGVVFPRVQGIRYKGKGTQQPNTAGARWVVEAYSLDPSHAEKPYLGRWGKTQLDALKELQEAERFEIIRGRIQSWLDARKGNQ